MTPTQIDEAKALLTAHLRDLWQRLDAAVKAVWAAIKRIIRPVRKYRAPNEHWRSQTLVRKVTPATYIPVRRHPSARCRQRR